LNVENIGGKSMTAITRFEEIQAWQTARQLTNLVYTFTGQSGFAKDFGLKDQIRRAAVSVMSNIAEGYESRTDTQFTNYLGSARGSAGEVRAQLYIALDQKYISSDQFKAAYELADKASRQIANFIKYLETNPRPRRVGKEDAEYETQS
jgi:four helix bundle protein